MKVTLIGWSAFRMPERAIDTAFGLRAENNWLNDNAETPGDLLAEMAGRLCYDSYNLPNKASGTNEGYLKNIAEQQHFSVMEHASASFLIEGVSRSLLMEMRTHRHASFSARSTRYVDETRSRYVVPPALAEYFDSPFDAENPLGTVGDELDHLMDHSTQLYSTIVDFLISKGSTRKQAREAAREVLPGATRTEFVMTANHHAWRDILRKRTAPGAAREIRELSTEILRQLHGLAPNTFRDIPWA